MVHFREIVEYHIEYPESEEFAKWAWGESYKEIVRDQLPQYWNEFHGHQLTLFPDGYMWDDIPLMIELWRKYNEDK